MCERGTDFASTFGIGGVIGSNFAWPAAPGMAETKRKKPLMTPEREQLWQKWTTLYNEKRLSQGEYPGQPLRHRAHVVAKPTPSITRSSRPSFDGRIELRGLEARAYRLTDYVNAPISASSRDRPRRLRHDSTSRC